jgi:hypothetical protein
MGPPGTDALPLVRRLVDGNDDLEARNAVKVLAAIHFGRGYGFAETFARIVEETRLAEAVRIAARPDITRLWEKEFGHPAEPGEIEGYIQDRAGELFDDGRLPVLRMGNAHKAALDKLIPLHVQIIRRRSAKVDLITGDVPFLHFDRARVGRAGLRERLALGDANGAYMPLSPGVAVMFTTRDEGDQVAPPYAVQQMNLWIWRGAYRYIACHPTTDLTRALPVSLSAAG